LVWQYNAYALPLFFAAFMSVGLALFMLGARRRAFGASAFIVLLLLIAEWSLADGLEYMSADLPSILFWDKAAYVGLVSAPVAYLIFVLYHTGRDGWLRTRTISLLFIIPVITLLLRWTDEIHHLIYSEYGLVTSYGVSILQWSWGSWFYVDAAYSYILVLFGIALLAQQFSRSQGVARRQSLILIFSVLVPLAAAVVEVLNVVAYPVDWTSLAFTFTGFGFFWVVFRFRLFELMPVAREAVFQEMSDGVLVLDESNRIAAINPACERVFECDARNIIGKKAADFFRSHKLDETYLTETSSDIALTVGGARHYFNLSFSPLRDESGEHVGEIGVMRDITERKRSEEALRESEHKLKAVVYGSPIPQFVIDRNHTIIYWNKALEEITGIKAEQVQGTNKQWSAFYSEERPTMADLLADGRTEQIPDFYDGKYSNSMLVADAYEATDYFPTLGRQGKWLHFTAVAIKDPEGNVIGAIETLEDITERKLSEDEIKRYSGHLEDLVKERTGELVESEARYRRLFESSPISLWEEDFSEVKRYFDELHSRGVKDLREYLVEHPEDVAKCAGMVKILDVNEASLGMYGAKSVEELRGELRRVLFTHDSQLQFEEELVALGEGNLRFATEFDNQTLTGDIKHVSLILNVVPGYEETLGKVLVSIIDLTERKKMEQRLQQAEHLAAVGETAAMVGHDLRNPLQGIAGAIFLLRNESLTAEERSEMLQLVENSVEYSDGIVKDLLDYARPFELARLETTPKQIAASALRAVHVPSRIKVQDQTQEQPRIWVDPDRIKRAFVNLVENAVDGMPNGGILTISSKESNDFVELVISDTGTSIPEEVTKNLWRPLQTTKAKGIGMGLAIVKRIVDAHYGEISVESKTGEGATFTIRLPIKPNRGE
jgi:PAS domain S-box-containing protein